MKRLSSAAVLPLTAVLLMAALAAAPGFAQNPSERTVQVAGHGEAKAKPDTVVVSFAVENQADTADACTAQHAAKVRKLVDALKDKTGPALKITTGDFSLTPTTVYSPPAGGKPAPVETPWVLSMGVNVETDSLDDLGQAVDAAIAAGASSRIPMSGFQQVPVEKHQGGSGGAAAPSHAPAFAGPLRYYGAIPMEMKQVAFAQVEIATEGASIAECTRKAGEILHRVEKQAGEKLKGKGRIYPASFNIGRQQGQSPAGYTPPPPPPTPQKQVYQARSTVTAQATELDRLGAIVQAGMTSGASTLNNVTFTLGNDSRARKDAIDKASGDARSKAQEVAKSMGVKLGNVLRITTSATPLPQVIYGGAFGAGFGARAVTTEQALPVMPREVSFTADVSVAYAIE